MFPRCLAGEDLACDVWTIYYGQFQLGKEMMLRLFIYFVLTISQSAPDYIIRKVENAKRVQIEDNSV